MAKPYSMELRERVVAAVEHEGMSRRGASRRFTATLPRPICPKLV